MSTWREVDRRGHTHDDLQLKVQLQLTPIRITTNKTMRLCTGRRICLHRTELFSTRQFAASILLFSQNLAEDAYRTRAMC